MQIYTCYKNIIISMSQKNRDNYHGKSRRVFYNLNTINPHLFCSICLDPFEDPHRLLCGHTFCYTCILHWNKANRKSVCAQCKQQVGKRKAEKDLLASKMIDELLVKCVHEKCKWVGIVGLMKKHQRKCEYKERKKQDETELIKGGIVSLDDDLSQCIMEVNLPSVKGSDANGVWQVIYGPDAPASSSQDSSS